MNRQKEENWWSRNWKWFVPVGCLGTILIFSAFIVLILSLIFGIMKSSDVYRDALETARADSAVVEALGVPIEEGWFVTGNIDVSGSSGDADLAIPISGPRGKATLYVKAAKSAGQWEYSTLVVDLENTGERIELLQ